MEEMALHLDEEVVYPEEVTVGSKSADIAHRWSGERNQTFGMVVQVVKGDARLLALREGRPNRAHVAKLEGCSMGPVDEPAEVAVAVQSLNEQHDLIAIIEPQFRADDWIGRMAVSFLARLQGRCEADNAVQPVRVSQSERAHP